MLSRLSVEDISTGGVRLRGRAELHVGDPVRLWLQAEAGQIVALGGTVVRRERRDATSCVGVAFNALSADAEEAIDGLLAGQLGRLRRPLVIIAGAKDDEARRRGRALHGEGYRTRTVGTPLDLIRALDAEGDIAVVALGPRLGGVAADVITSFVAHVRPDVPCVPLERRA